MTRQMFQSPSNRVNIPNEVIMELSQDQLESLFQSPSNRVNIPNMAKTRPT